MLHCLLCDETRPFHADDCRVPVLTLAEELDWLEQRQEGGRQ